MASKLFKLQAKANQATLFVAKRGCAYLKHYIQEPQVEEKYNLLSKQLFHNRLAISRSSHIGESRTVLPTGFQRNIISAIETAESTFEAAYPKPFCEWIAGIIDGGGSFEVEEKHVYLVIVTNFEDSPLLNYIRHTIGGHVSSTCHRTAYELHCQLGMIKLIRSVNGHIRDPVRVLQLHRICQMLGIPLILPHSPDAQSNWFAGFFDADGVIDIELTQRILKLHLHVKSHRLDNIEPYKTVLGYGNVCYDSGMKGYYKWCVESHDDIFKLLDYFYTSTFRSRKSRRLFLLKEYLSLYDINAFDPRSVHYGEAMDFMYKWKKVTI